MFRQFLPKVTLSVSDRDCLERLAFIAAEDHHPAAPFLISELCRAEIVSDGAVELEPVVGMNTWVNYRLNWGSPIETQKLVYPDDCVSADDVSVLSPVGTALAWPQGWQPNAVLHECRMDERGQDRTCIAI